MKICAAQLRPVQGDIPANIAKHKRLIDLALSHGADTIVFPELSLTGYEPERAKELAIAPDDRRFDDFQRIADSSHATLAIGIPTRSSEGICISLLIFQPHQPRRIYSKQYLHPDEDEFFVSGENSFAVIGGEVKLAPAICYELSVPAHAESAGKNGAAVYLASVAKSAGGVENAVPRLAAVAARYAMTVVMANCIGASSGFASAGRSSVWNDRGVLLGQLDGTHEGILLFDTATQAVLAKTI